MNRQIVIKRCKECPFVEYMFEVIKKNEATDVYYCNHDSIGYDEEIVDESKIPDWCPLEIEK